MAIINKLRDLRFEFKLDQNDFAVLLGVHRGQYNRWENNRAQPTLEWAMRIAKKTNRQVESFIILEE